MCGRWWDRSYTDETNDPNDMYDRGAPDYKAEYPDEERELLDGRGRPTGKMGTYQKPKDLKWRIVCAGVQRLIEKEGLDEADVMLWFDWQSSALRGSSNPGLQPRASPAAHARSLCPPHSLPGRQGQEARRREEPDQVGDDVPVHARADRGGGDLLPLRR